MSIPFSAFIGALGPATVIANGLLGMGGHGWVAGTPLNIPPDSVAVPPATAVPPELDQQLNYIANRWGDVSEKGRRVMIDAFVQAIMRPLAPPGVIPGGVIAPGAIPVNLRVVAEQHLAANGPGGVGAQIGHGYFDYLLANPLAVGHVENRLRPGVVFEAKRDLGGTHNHGQWQLCAQMATAKQLAGVFRITRGFLSDGRFWRFYELEVGVGMVGGPRLQRSIPYDTNIPGDRTAVVRMLQNFVVRYNNALALL